MYTTCTLWCNKVAEPQFGLCGRPSNLACTTRSLITHNDVAFPHDGKNSQCFPENKDLVKIPQLDKLRTTVTLNRTYTPDEIVLETHEVE
jgi:hypothetical protein